MPEYSTKGQFVNSKISVDNVLRQPIVKRSRPAAMHPLDRDPGSPGLLLEIMTGGFQFCLLCNRGSPTRTRLV